jgi:site-specific DNA recombinase
MVRREFPEQRIVSEDLWAKVEARMKRFKEVYGGQNAARGLFAHARAMHSPYLFSGLLKCGECGANLVIVSGSGRNHAEPDYGCPMHRYRNTCSNAVRIRKDVLERQLLEKLQREVLREDLIQYALARFEDELTKVVRDADGRMARLERKKRKLERELHNLEKMVRSGLDSRTLRAGIADTEREISDIHSQIISAQPESVRTKIKDARRFVQESLRDVRKLLNTDPVTAKATLARHMPSIVLKPQPDKRYAVTSQWELLPTGALGYTDGAEGQS